MRTIAILLLLASPCLAGEPPSIPLGDIWAFDMPGTKSMRHLDPLSDDVPYAGQPETKSFFWKMMKALQKPKHDNRIGTVFIVVGDPQEALLEASLVLQGKKNPRDVLPTDANLSLVFFARSGGEYVQITSVESGDTEVTINYRRTQHMTANLSYHAALIPIGRRSSGSLAVRIHELPTLDEYGQPGYFVRSAKNRISGNRTFCIQELEN